MPSDVKRHSLNKSQVFQSTVLQTAVKLSECNGRLNQQLWSVHITFKYVKYFTYLSPQSLQEKNCSELYWWLGEFGGTYGGKACNRSWFLTEFWTGSNSLVAFDTYVTSTTLTASWETYIIFVVHYLKILYKSNKSLGGSGTKPSTLVLTYSYNFVLKDISKAGTFDKNNAYGWGKQS